MNERDIKSKNKYCNLDRGTLIYAAGFPGSCYLFLKKFHYLLWYMLGYATIVFVWTVIPDLLLRLITSGLLYVLMMFISAIDAEYQCNLLGMPYRDPNWELRIKDYGHTYRKWILIFSISGIVSFVIDMIVFGFIPINILVLIIWSMIAIIGSILVNKYRNVTYLDMPICETRKIQDPEVIAYYDGLKKELKTIKAIPKKDKRLAIISLTIMGLVLLITFLVVILILANN